MIRIPGRIPITIFPVFWLCSALIGFLLSGNDLIQIPVWVGIIFVSVLIHEFGHALASLAFGRHPRIELVAMGGLTYHDGDKLAFWKQFLITLNGPLFGFLLAVLAFYLRGLAPFLLERVYAVNIIWTIVNLLPILPLDGGQLLRIVLEAIFHAKGVRYALLASAILAFGFSLFLLLNQNFLAGAIFFFFAFENFNSFKRTRGLTESDRSDSSKKALAKAEMLLQDGKKKEAKEAFEAIVAATKGGVLYVLASQYLAFLDNEAGKGKEAYELLLPLKDSLEPEGLCLLHRVAFEQRDFPLALHLAGPVFQLMPEAEVALRSAEAAANWGQVEPAIGWLQSALQCGVENIREIIQEKAFDHIRTTPAFQAFLSSVSAM